MLSGTMLSYTLLHADGGTFHASVKTHHENALTLSTGSCPFKCALMPGGPCIPGQNKLFITTDGKFLPCERVSEISPAMLIGNLEHGFDTPKVLDLINIGQLTEARCLDCWAFRHCALCAKHADDKGQLSGSYKLRHCRESYNTLSTQIRESIMISEYHGVYKHELKEIVG